MNATISLDGLLSFIRSLSLSPDNKDCGSWSDDPRTPEEIATDIRQARQFGMTRHITPLCNNEKE